VASAAAAARRLLATAEGVALPPGLVGERDLVLESALAEHPPALHRLAAVLDPVRAHEHLAEALVAFLASDGNREPTAAALFLSPGGLSLRLDRIAQLTGFDPRTSRGARVLGAALSARSLLDRP
ncbi:helix-turn-helix domain-containing protein, partial [Pseudonocardia nigra]|uniref:helix-turn-helix domain-containing protein n=1 Tax=Pseudonocardia nigra TaxID=1921578 RepID=UPI001C5D2C51